MPVGGLPDQLSYPHGTAPYSVFGETFGPYSAYTPPLSVGELAWPAKGEALNQKYDFPMFFGENPGYVPRQNAHESYRQEYMNLPQAYHGPNHFLSSVIVNTVSLEDQWPIREALPWRKNDTALTITWDKWIFDNHLLNRNPEQSVPRLLTSRRESKSASIIRMGIAFMLEFGFMQTPMGRIAYKSNLRQMANSVIETLNLAVVNAILTCDFKRSPSQTPPRLNNIDVYRNILGQQKMQFGIIQKSEHGLALLFTRIRQNFQAKAQRPFNYVILPRGTETHINASLKGNGVYFMREDMSSKQSIKQRSQSGVTVREWPHHNIGYENANENTNPSASSRIIAGHFVHDTEYLNNVEPEHFKTAMMDVVVYSEDSNKQVVMSYADAVASNIMFEQRPLVDGEHADDENLSESMVAGGVGTGVRVQYARKPGARGPLNTLSAVGERALGPYGSWYEFLKEHRVLGKWKRSLLRKGKNKATVEAFLCAFSPEYAAAKLGASSEPSGGGGKNKPPSSKPAAMKTFVAVVGNARGPGSGAPKEREKEEKGAQIDPRARVADYIIKNTGVATIPKEQKRFAHILAYLWARGDDEVMAWLNEAIVQGIMDNAKAEVVGKDWKAPYQAMGKLLTTGLLTTGLAKKRPQTEAKANVSFVPGHTSTLNVIGSATVMATYADANDGSILSNAANLDEATRSLQGAAETLSFDNGVGAIKFVEVSTNEAKSFDTRNLTWSALWAPVIEAARKLNFKTDKGKNKTGKVVGTELQESLQRAIDKSWDKHEKEIERVASSAGEEKKDVAGHLRLAEIERLRALNKDRNSGLDSKDPVSPSTMPDAIRSELRTLLNDFGDHVDQIWSRRADEITRDRNNDDSNFRGAKEFQTIMKLVQKAYKKSREASDDKTAVYESYEILLSDLYHASLLNPLPSIREVFTSTKDKDRTVDYIQRVAETLHSTRREVRKAVLAAIPYLKKNSFGTWFNQTFPGRRFEDLNDKDADELRGTFGSGGPGNAFSGDKLTDSELDLILKAIPIINADFVHFSLLHDCWPLFFAYGHRMSKEYVMSPAAFLRGFGELGNTLHGHHSMNLSDNTARGIHIGVLNLYAKPIIFNEEFLELVHDVFCSDYVRGNDTSVWNLQDADDLRAFRTGVNAKSVVYFLGPPDQYTNDKPYLNINGQEHSLVAGNNGGVESFPAWHDLQAEYLGLTESTAPCTWANPQIEDGICYNTVSFQEGQYKAIVEGDRIIQKGIWIQNEGHWGSGDCVPGCKDVRKLAAMYMLRPNVDPYSYNQTGVTTGTLSMRV